jgi:translation initiation factor IF-3
MPLEAALEQARTEGLDLVEISPMASPPVCKIMDYGKFKYEEKKKASEAKRAQVTVLLKEVKLRPKTEDHDYDFKVRNMRRFIEDGNKAKVVIQFRGREITHREQGTAILEDVAKDLKEVAIVEQPPRMEGRLMFMILAPTPKVAQKARELVRQAAVAAKRTPPPAEKAAAEKAAAEKAAIDKAAGEKIAAEKAASKQAAAATAGAPAEEKKAEQPQDAKPADSQSAAP